MMSSRIVHRIATWLTCLLCTVPALPGGAISAYAADEKLQVFTTVPDWASLAQEIGGDQVEVSSMVFGREDPHFAEPRPTFVKKLAAADVFITTGLELEAGYEEPLLTNARNPKVMPSTPGYIVAASAISEIVRPQANVVISRAMGNVHASGNPHFNLSPLGGLAVAGLIRDRFSQIRPAKAASFAEHYASFRRRLGEKLVGKALNDKYDGAKLARLAALGKLEPFLEGQGDRDALGGWLGMMAPHRGAKVVDDHPMWLYFARQFGIVIAADLEKAPGIQPSTSHMKSVIEMMKAQGIEVIIKAPFYDPRFARFVAEHTGARIAELAHQVGAVPSADDYLSMLDYDVRTLTAALATAQPVAGEGR